MSDHKITTPETTAAGRFQRREGDWRQEGSNNTLIVLGTDRAIAGGGPAGLDDGLGSSTGVEDAQGRRIGAVHLVAGRIDPFNTDLVGDDAYLYLVSSTDVDQNIAAPDLGGNGEWKDAGADDGRPVAAAVMKSEYIRLVYRNSGDIRILSDGGKSYLVMNDKFIDGYVSDHVWMQAGNTKFEIQKSNNPGVARLGPLVKALTELATIIANDIADPSLNVGLGNMLAPIPNIGTMQNKLAVDIQVWQNKWLTGDYIKEA